MSTQSMSAVTSPWSWSRPTGLASVGLLVTVVVWVWLSGPLALLFGGVLALGVVALSAPFGFALGQVLVLGVVSGGGPVELLLAEGGLLLILLTEFSSTTHSLRHQLATVTTLAVVGGIGTLAVLFGVDVWTITAIGVVLAVLTAYGLHRFELVALDLVLED